MNTEREARWPTFKNKLLASMLVVSISCSVILNVRQLCAFGENSADILPIHIFEGVDIFSNGDAELSMQTNIPESPLADVYRRTLAVPPNVSVGQEIPIPETTMQGGVAVPVRQEYYRSIKQEQKYSFGFTTSILDSSIVPKNGPNGCKVSVSGIATLQVANVTSVGPDGLWEVAIGPRDENGTGYVMGQVITEITFAQMLLKSMEGEQVFESTWTTRIRLPATSILLNREELDGLSWTLSLGGGTFMSAFVFADGASTIVLDERTVFTEQNITESPTEIFQALLGYKAFKIKYLLPNSASAGRARLESGDFERDWSRSWSSSWSDTATASFDFGDHSVSLTVAPSISLSAYIGWDFDWIEHEVWPGIPYWTYDASRFEAWIGAEASLKIGFNVTTTVGASKSWAWELFSRTLAHIEFTIGYIPVFINLKFNGNAILTVSVSANITFTFEATLETSFKAGAQWTRSGGWSAISDADAHVERVGPAIDVHQVEASITPSLQFRLAFLLYDSTGPYVEFNPYVKGTITYYPDDDVAIWNVTVAFKINTGILFSVHCWITDFLHISDVDKSYTIYERSLASWTGHWGQFSSSILIEVSPNPTYKGGGTMIAGEISSRWPGNKAGTVIMEYSSDGQSWNTLPSVTSKPDGEYAYWWKLQGEGNFSLRSRWDGNSDYKGNVSETATLEVDSQAIGETLSVQDDGNEEGFESESYPDGFAVRLTPPKGLPAWVLTAIDVTGKLGGLSMFGPASDFEILVMNGSQVLFRQTYKSDFFSNTPSTATIPISEIVFSQDPRNPTSFYVCVFPHKDASPLARYVEVGVDTSSPPSGDSYLVHETIMWPKSHITLTPVADRNFMIRAEGVNLLENATLCKGISGPHDDPVDPTEVFYIEEPLTDQRIYSWVKFHGAPFATEHLIEWKWYDPTGEYSVTTNQHTAAGWSGVAHSVLRADNPDIPRIINDWFRTPYHQNWIGVPFKVKIYFDGMLYGQLVFRLTKHVSSISVSSSTNSTTLGQSLEVSSQLVPSSAFFSGRGALYLENSIDQSNWTMIASGAPSDEGYFSYTWTPSSAGSYFVRARFSGTNTYFGDKSMPLTILVDRVTTALSISISPTTIVQGSNATATATITPKLQGKTTVFQSSADEASWFCIGSGTTDSNGQCNCTWAPIRLGNKQYVRAVWYGDPDFKEANSTSNILTVEIPPTTTLTVEEPNVINNSICVTSKTLFTLTAEDSSGSGLAGTSYRLYNATYDTGEKPYTQPFNITGLSDGKYIVDYYSRDKAGTTEPANKAVILFDNCPPVIESPTREPAGDVQPDQSVKILVAITDNATQVRNATLSYTTNTGVDWTDQQMVCNLSTGLYEATIPAQSIGTSVEYVITANDQTGNNATRDKTSGYCTYQVVPEYDPTAILLLIITISTFTLASTRKKWPKRNKQLAASSTSSDQSIIQN